MYIRTSFVCSTLRPVIRMFILIDPIFNSFHLCKKKYCIKDMFMYFLFNADLSKFDSEYYNIRYIHSLLLNSGPWTETIKTTLNIKQNKASEQEALNIIPAPMWLTPPPPCPPPPYLPPPSPPQHICYEFWNERKQKELWPKYVNNCLGLSIPEHVV